MKLSPTKHLCILVPANLYGTIMHQFSIKIKNNHVGTVTSNGVIWDEFDEHKMHKRHHICRMLNQDFFFMGGNKVQFNAHFSTCVHVLYKETNNKSTRRLEVCTLYSTRL